MELTLPYKPNYKPKEWVRPVGYYDMTQKIRVENENIETFVNTLPLYTLIRLDRTNPAIVSSGLTCFYGLVTKGAKPKEKIVNYFDCKTHIHADIRELVPINCVEGLVFKLDSLKKQYCTFTNGGHGGLVFDEKNLHYFIDTAKEYKTINHYSNFKKKSALVKVNKALLNIENYGIF